MKTSIAVLFAYDGTQFDGLERERLNKESKTVEQALFKAFPRDTTSITHISRASLTGAHEHAAKQVISLNYGGEEIPEVEAVNAQLATEAIKVFKIIPVDKDFSARRTCEARTVEVLIPSYVFAPPPASTHYCNPTIMEEPMVSENLSDQPKGGLFTTLKRGRPSLDRRNTFSKNGQRASTTPLKEPVTEKKRFWTNFLNSFKDLFKPSKGSERLKRSLDNTMTAQMNDVEDRPQEAFSETLRRSFSQKRTLESVLTTDIKERNNEEVISYEFDPLEVPTLSDADMMELKSYRMPLSQYNTVVSTLALFNGTHNFHNYIPGSVQDDSRCFVHVFNVDATPLEIHHGMEWVRVKIQANSFARDQIRPMMILVTRTNTPRSVVGNSFGFSKIDIPECPLGYQILDEPHYNNFNADCLNDGKTPISFGDVQGIEEFRAAIQEKVYEEEASEMKMQVWLQELDRFSFMYVHFLNERGVITKPKNYPTLKIEQSEQSPAIAA